MKALQIYDFKMAAGGSFPLPVEGSYFRVLSALGNVSVIGDSFGKLTPLATGQGLENTPYRRLTIVDVSGSANAGTILVSSENFIDNRLYGVVSLDAPTLAALEQTNIRPEAYFPLAPIVPVAGVNTILTPAQNPNGFIVQELQAMLLATTSGQGTFLAKASAPATMVDGDGIGGTINYVNAANALYNASIRNILIPAGKGIYFFSVAGSVYSANAAFITLVGKQL